MQGAIFIMKTKKELLKDLDTTISFSIDREKALRLARELDLEIEFDSIKTGVLEDKTGNRSSLNRVFFSES